MIQEEKDLLLQDLCARLPYGVKVQESTLKYDRTWKYRDIDLTIDNINSIIIDFIKPYLFPLSSMTDDQKKYITDRWGINEDFDFEIDPDWGEYFVDLGDVVDYVNWLIANHFDYKGLIQMGLAIDATNKNIY